MSQTEPLTPEHAPPTPIRVEVLDSALPEQTFSAGSFSIGSAPDNDVVLPDKSVSGRHARAEILPGAVRIVDLESTNGTRYLGAKVREALIPIGGEVTLGRTRLRFTTVKRRLVSKHTEVAGLLGHSESMQQVLALVERLAHTSFSVLLQGETGTGKGAVALAIHKAGERANQPFVVFDCGAVSSGLIESTLFGHVKGAFTGAIDNRVGALESAADGTLLIDEVGELPLDLQPKLLRALDSRRFMPVGASQPKSMHCRVVAATHRNLEALAQKGQFRSDLFFRLTQSTVHIPPLRQRREDILPLVDLFAKQFLHAGSAPFSLSPATIATLQSSPWPGNVRQLRNAVERALALGELGDDAKAADANADFDAAREEVVRLFEREYLTALVKKHDGNLSAVAREAGMQRSRLYRVLVHAGLRSATADES